MANFIPWMGKNATTNMQSNYSSTGFVSNGYITALGTNASLRMPSLIAGAVADLFHLNDNTNLSIDSSVADVLAYMQNTDTHIKLGGLTIDHYRSIMSTLSGVIQVQGPLVGSQSYALSFINTMKRDRLYKITIKIDEWPSSGIAEFRPRYITTFLYIDNESKSPETASSTLVYMGLQSGDIQATPLYLCGYVTDPDPTPNGVGTTFGYIYFKFGDATNTDPYAGLAEVKYQHVFSKCTLYINELFPITAPEA